MADHVCPGPGQVMVRPGKVAAAAAAAAAANNRSTRIGDFSVQNDGEFSCCSDQEIQTRDV